MLTDVLKVKILAVVCVGLLVLLGVGWSVHAVQVKALNHTIDGQAEKIGALTVEVATLTAVNDAMKKAVEEQNLKVEGLQQKAEEASLLAQKDMDAAKAEGARWMAKYKSILNAPPTSPDVCRSLSVRVAAYIAARQEGGL